MASLPYVSFVNDPPVNEDRKALAAVGRCRVDLTNLSNVNGSVQEKYQALVGKNRQQAMVGMEAAIGTAGTAGTAKDEELEKQNKKDKKKLMKEGNAMAAEFLQTTLQLDPSVVDVEVVVEGSDLIETDGCLAACLLDAGCALIVTDGENLPALEAAQIPKDRLMAHFVVSSPWYEDITAAVKLGILSPLSSLCQAVSLEFTQVQDLKHISTLHNQIFPSIERVTFQFHSDVAMQYLEQQQEQQQNAETEKEKKETDDSSSSSMEQKLAQFVAKTCQLGMNKKGGRRDNVASTVVALTDPTVEQLGLSLAACFGSDRPDGLFSTVVCSRNGEALGFVYSSTASIVESLKTGRGVYYSRNRGLWRKGDTSGHYQSLHRLDVDCDRDAVRFTVTQRGEPCGAFCHLETLTCWGPPRGLRHLEQTLKDRLFSAPEGSYSKRLFDDNELLRNKLVEEAQELSEATEPQHVAEELADVLYFAMTRAVKAGVSLDDAVAELDKRARKVTRRKGDSKEFRIAAGQAILEKSEKE